MNRRDVPDVYTQVWLYAQGYQFNHNCTSSMLCYVTLAALGGSATVKWGKGEELG